jgi:hypothetical protein
MAIARQKDTVFVALQNVRGGKKRKIESNWRLPGTASDEKEMDEETNGSSGKEAIAIDTSSLMSI